eukprot:TRINITY_DN56160_c0_g1_i1.p1 TRINITY_DN56160_c0_g1~~TRINITY_DN56160_c0_g1_i1.p1  ORF type:complete len:569 (+),score=75.95 TRINITY_DN56160_c0_g1_i1:90-1796(+)
MYSALFPGRPPAEGDRVEVMRRDGSWQPATVTTVTGDTGADGVWVGAVMAQWGRHQKAVPVPSPFIRPAPGAAYSAAPPASAVPWHSDPLGDSPFSSEDEALPRPVATTGVGSVVPISEHLHAVRRLESLEEEVRQLRGMMSPSAVPPAPRSSPTAGPAESRRLTVGDTVSLAPGRDAGNALAPGESGVIVRDDRDDQPYEVVGPRGASCWCAEDDLVRCSDPAPMPSIQPVATSAPPSAAPRLSSIPPAADQPPSSAAATLPLDEGAEVAVAGFEGAQRGFNGIRGRVIATRGDGKLLVRFALLGGTTLTMRPQSLSRVGPPGDLERAFPLGCRISAGGPQGTRGRVVGYRGGLLLCEFARVRAGVFPVRPQDAYPLPARRGRPGGDATAVDRAVSAALKSAASGEDSPPAGAPSPHGSSSPQTRWPHMSPTLVPLITPQRRKAPSPTPPAAVVTVVTASPSAPVTATSAAPPRRVSGARTAAEPLPSRPESQAATRRQSDWRPAAVLSVPPSAWAQPTAPPVTPAVPGDPTLARRPSSEPESPPPASCVVAPPPQRRSGSSAVPLS